MYLLNSRSIWYLTFQQKTCNYIFNSFKSCRMLDGIPKKTWYAGLMEVVNRLMVKGKSASEIEQAAVYHLSCSSQVCFVGHQSSMWTQYLNRFSFSAYLLENSLLVSLPVLLVLYKALFSTNCWWSTSCHDARWVHFKEKVHHFWLYFIFFSI